MSENNEGIPTQPETEDGILDYLLIIAQNIRLLILGPICVAVIALGISFVVKPTFTSEAVFLPPQQQQSLAASMLQSLGALGALPGAAGGLKNPADQYIAFLRTNAVEDALIARFKLAGRYEKTTRDDTRKVLAERTHITSGKDGLIHVQFDDHDAHFASDVANAYIEELGQLLNRLAVTEAQQRRAFFEKQLKSTKNSLIIAEQSLAASGVSVAALNATPSTALEGPARLRAQVTAAEVKMASMRSYLTEQAPEFKQAQAELAALRSQLGNAERSQPPAKGGGDYIAKYREFKYQETLFELFSRQFELAKIDESREGAIIQMVDAAQPSERKSRPRRGAFIFIPAAVAAVVLLAFVFLRNAWRRSQKDPETALKLHRLMASFGFRLRDAGRA